MKGKKLIVLVMALIFVLLTVSTVNAKSERIDFTFTEACDWSTIQIERVIINGQGNELDKQFAMTCTETGSIPQYTGNAYVTLNINSVGNGTVWLWESKGLVETDEGGIWNLNCVYPWPSDDAQCVGHGEGKYAGQQIFLHFFAGAGGTGYIVDHSN